MIPTRRLTAAWLVSLASFPGISAHAANDALPDWAPKPPPNIVEDRFRAEVLLFGAGIDTRLRVDPQPTIPGTALDAEDDLGLDDSALMPQAELTLLPATRHLIRLSALSTRRSADHVIEREIVFDDQVYRAGERVDSTLDLTMFGLTYGHRFLVRDRGEITGTLGIQVASFEANAVVRSRVIREEESGTAPLPLIGVEGRFDFTRRWSAEARVQYLSVEIDEADGSIFDARAAVTWRMNPYLVFGLGYRRFEIEVRSRDVDTSGYVDMNLRGPLLFVRASL